jgi:hypothetical protein
VLAWSWSDAVVASRAIAADAAFARCYVLISRFAATQRRESKK